MDSQRSLKMWENFIKKEGYSIEFKKYEYWIVPCAIKDNEFIPLCVITYRNGWSSCVDVRYIKCSEKAFYALKRYYLSEDRGRINLILKFDKKSERYSLDFEINEL